MFFSSFQLLAVSFQFVLSQPRLSTQHGQVES
jgi:hypothetical protein